jgi:hypothetical protein
MAVYCGPVIGITGSAMLLYYTLSLMTPEKLQLVAIGQALMSTAPLLTLPSFIRSAWVQHQPTWVLGGFVCFAVWVAFLLSQESILGKAVLITMAGLAFSGLSNLVHPKRPHVVLSPLASIYFWRHPVLVWRLLVKIAVFVANDIKQLLVFAYLVGAELCRLPFNIIQSLFARQLLPSLALQTFHPNNLWMSRRLGGALFVLSGLLLLSHELFTWMQSDSVTLGFRTLNGIGACVINYSLFFTGLFGKHWSDKFLLPGCLLATVGSCFFDTTWGFALNQLGVRMNELYFVTLQFRPSLVQEQVDSKRAPTENSHDELHLLY